MTASDIKLYNESIIKNLICDYKMEKDDAEKAVSQSVFQSLIKDYPDIVIHYPVDSWSKDIWREYNKLPNEDN